MRLKEDQHEETLQVSLDAEMMSAAESLYQNLGTSLSEAIRIFVRQSLNVGGMPFDMRMIVVQPEKKVDGGSFGLLSKYANGGRRKMEKTAWAHAAVDKECCRREK